jgi:hypothetical protein
LALLSRLRTILRCLSFTAAYGFAGFGFLQSFSLLFYFHQEFLHVRLAPLGRQLAGKGAMKKNLCKEVKLFMKRFGPLL